MKRSSVAVTLGLCGLLALAVPVSADSGNVHQVNDRIKALRERLNAFRSRGKTGAESVPAPATEQTQGGSDTKAVSVAADNLTPLELSEELEHRKDAKVIILFSDRMAPAEKNFRREPPPKPRAEPVKEKPATKKGTPKKVQDFWKALRGSAEA